MQIIREKSFYRELFALVLPIYLQQLLRISVDTVNSLMLGSIDQVQMSGISQANQVFFVYYTICCGLSVGVSVLVSQYWGKKDVDHIPAIIAHGLRMAAVLGLVYGCAVHFFPEVFMRIYSSDPEIIAVGAGHLRKVSLMYMVCGLSVVIFGASRGMAKMKIILFTNIISYSINILLDYLLIFGRLGFPVMGAVGVSYGTLAARYAEFFICTLFFLKASDIPFELRHLKVVDGVIRRSLFSVTAPIVCHEVVWSLGTSSGAMITGQLGREVVGGYNVTTVLYDLGASYGNGLLNASSVVLGMTLGRGELERAKREANTMILLGLLSGIVLGTITFLVRDLFLGFYALNEQSAHYARQFMTVIAFIWPFSMLEMIGMIAILRSGGQGKVGFYTDIVVMFMICIPFASYLAFKVQAEPWIIVLSIKMIIVFESIIGIINVYRYKWLRNLTAA